jgi:hypothetical protein
VYFDTFTAKAKEGDITALQHVMSMGGPRMFAQLDGFKKAMADIGQTVRKIDQNPQITPAEKRQLIDTLYMSEIQLARQGLQAMRQIDSALEAR